MNIFAGITEGLTDQIVIENILVGYFKNPDIDVNWLQPLRDETDKNRSKGHGGWHQVFEYCESDNFKEAFQYNEYIIIQIDTDVSEEVGYDIPKLADGREFSPEQLIRRVGEKFKGLIGEDFYEQYGGRIIFAISVHSIECWLLPLYYTDNRKSKVKNCLDTLNQRLQSVEGFRINPANKNIGYYNNVSGKYGKHKILMASRKENPSLKIFVEELQKRKFVIEEDDYGY